jgi:hypothetical protein
VITDPEARARLQAEYDERKAKLDAECERCRYCKAAQTRKRKRLITARTQGRWFGTTTIIERLAAQERCGPHAQRYHLMWVNSPLSESYWSS